MFFLVFLALLSIANAINENVIQSPTNNLIAYRLDNADQIALGKDKASETEQAFQYQGPLQDTVDSENEKPITDPFLEDAKKSELYARNSRRAGVHVDDSNTNQETAQNDKQEPVYIKYYDPSTGTYKYYKKTTTATEAPTYLCYYPCYTNPYPYYSYQPSYGYGGGYGGNLFSIGSGFNIGGFGIGSGLGISLG
uniref:Uncharacterized protein n=1 Tax=Acrobeloides nanus TaxID=290746 RepID=A0A914CZK1_9BILA